MSKKETTIGTIINVDHMKIQKEKSFWEKDIFPFLNEVIQYYQSLNAGPFSSEILNQLLSESFDKIEMHLYEINAEGTNSPALLEFVRSSSKSSSDKIKEKWLMLMKEFDRQFYSPTFQISADWTDVSISDGLPELNKEAIENKHTISIETETEAKAYLLMQDVKTAYDKLLGFSKKSGHEFVIIDFEGSGLLYTDTNNELILNAEMVKEFSK